MSLWSKILALFSSKPPRAPSAAKKNKGATTPTIGAPKIAAPIIGPPPTIGPPADADLAKMELLGQIDATLAAGVDDDGDAELDADEQFWQQVYTAREEFFRTKFGPLPDDILKLGHLFGIWPGGGLYSYPATQLGKNVYVHTTFGLSNADMPATTTTDDAEVETDEQGRVVSTSATLKPKERADAGSGRAGYGYEILIVTRGNTEWPLGLLAWAVNAEILNDAGILNRVEKYEGLTVEQIDVGPDDAVDVLIAKARAPIPTGVDLPNGRMEILVATVITPEEMEWSKTGGRNALLDRLYKAKVGPLSDRNRKSVIDAT